MHKYTVDVVANVTFSVEIEAKTAEEAKNIAENMQYDELAAKPLRIYSTEVVLDEDIKPLDKGAEFLAVGRLCGHAGCCGGHGYCSGQKRGRQNGLRCHGVLLLTSGATEGFWPSARKEFRVNRG